jgi:hypothetical protein
VKKKRQESLLIPPALKEALGFLARGDNIAQDEMVAVGVALEYVQKCNDSMQSMFSDFAPLQGSTQFNSIHEAD